MQRAHHQQIVKEKLSANTTVSQNIYQAVSGRSALQGKEESVAQIKFWIYALATQPAHHLLTAKAKHSTTISASLNIQQVESGRSAPEGKGESVAQIKFWIHALVTQPAHHLLAARAKLSNTI